MSTYQFDALTTFNALLVGARSFHAEVPWFFPSLAIFLLTVASSFLGGNGRINVPTVPPPTLFSRIVTPYKCLYDALTLSMLGMDLHGRFGRSFKIPCLSRWYLLIIKPHLINELKAIPPSIMSFRHQMDEQLRTDYGLYKGFMVEGSAPRIIKKHLVDGKSLARIFPLVQEEHRLAWRANIPSELQDSASTAWIAVDITSTLQADFSRATNRILFGVDLARNKEFTTVMFDYMVNMFESGPKLDSCPQFLQPLVSRWIYAWKERYLKSATAFLGPVIEERRQKLQALGQEWKNRPYDSIQWILEDEPEASTETLIYRLIFLVLASLGTSTLTMTHLIYDLAGSRVLQPLLREEIQNSMESGNLTYTDLSSCSLLDSVIKESSRMNGVEVVTVRRRCLKPYTFSDGTHVTTGTWVMAPASAIHRLPSVYPNPDTFDGFRFKNLRSTPGKESNYQFVQTSTDFLTFGHGSYSCPGRFFVGASIKALATELILNYEWRFKDGEKRPENISVGVSTLPGLASVLFRRLPEK